MLISIAIILISGMTTGWICRQLHLPALLGMLLSGVLLGPHALNLIDASILNNAADLRRIALLIILIRAGLSLRLEDLKKVGRPAVLMCFLPACFELAGVLFLAPKLLGLSLLDAAIMGAVLGAVSPAVIVPHMLKLMEEGYGMKQGIPPLILAGASVDDVFVIVLFSAFTGMASGTTLSPVRFMMIPLSIATGALTGGLLGCLLSVFFKKVHIRDTAKVLIILCLSFILVTLEDQFANRIPFSGLIAVITTGIALYRKHRVAAGRLSAKFNKLWIPAELMLFVLVGASVDLHYISAAGIKALLLIFGALLFRMSGVLCCLIKTKLTKKERCFCMFAYIPKATVQAAIGGIPLAMGLSCGTAVLTVAVLAILFTAPLGAFLITNTYQRLLTRI